MIKDKLISKLADENKDLKQQLKILIEQDHLKDEIVIQQSKMASMGEMIENIAHQWRQPLMEISTLMMNLEAKIRIIGDLPSEEILDAIDKSNNVVTFMSDTIEDFRNFFATSKQKENFFITEQISSVINIMKSSLTNKNIKINIIIKNNSKIYGFKNEYSQVLINILANSKDAIIANSIKNGQIIIKLYEKNNNSILEIEDNGKGITCKPIQKVFEPFFTYKKKNGTGIGLFMSKLIIENNMDGKLVVDNNTNGACFKIILPL